MNIHKFESNRLKYRKFNKNDYDDLNIYLVMKHMM